MISARKIITTAMLLISLTLLGEEETSPFTINSGEAEYNGREISLAGDVVVQHALGKISAHKFILSAPENDKKCKFSFLKIEDQVLIEFQHGGQLSCEKAEIDYDNLQGHFFGSKEQPDVVYSSSERNFNASATTTPLIIKGDEMQIDFVRSSEENSSKIDLNRIHILGNVRINYNEDYFLQAGQAIYLQNSLDKCGIIKLSADPFEFCEISNLQGDRIFAKTITIDTSSRSFNLTDPKGSLNHFQNHEEQKLTFSADSLSWNNQDLILTLSGHVDVEDNKNLHLKTEHQLSITHHMVNGKKEIRTIISPKETELTYFDLKETHKILCHGPLSVDQENAQIWMHSPKNPQGKVQPTEQVFFDDLLGEMCADQVLILYEKQAKQLQPKKINLVGNVQIFNRFNGHVEESSSVLQYALADEIEYLPESLDMQLFGKNGNRVLFFDKINGLQMSAPALKIHFDKTTKKESVQGVGDVRFTFIEQEFNQLKERFRMSDK